MRIAWIGPQPRASGGGVPEMAGQLLRHLARQPGVEVDAYAAVTPDNDLGWLAQDRLTIISETVRLPPEGLPTILRFVVGQVLRLLAQRRLLHVCLTRNTTRRYDVIYQFSQFELFGLRGRNLPPIVVHPETHAAGELRWLLKERRLARKSGRLLTWAVSVTMLSLRSLLQLLSARRVTGVIAPSKVFGDHLTRDYRVPSEVIRVVPNSVAVVEQANRTSRSEGDKVQVLFVSRMAVRKGVEMVIGLSHRLADLQDRVHIDLVGGHAMWSDYRPLLADLDERTATYRSQLTTDELAGLYAKADLLLQPSRYEPFALTVGEALAAGVPVLASEAVGALEFVEGECAMQHADGDLDDLERLVRRFVERWTSGRGTALADAAQRQAALQFRPEDLGVRVRAALEEFTGAGCASTP